MTSARPSLPPDFDPATVEAIHERLEKARKSGVTILFAIESGSRAWGFPSPDSDYDCRFVYARSIEDHLLLEAPRDVIEFPIEGDLDVGGWDLKKALLLALGGNAVIAEWVDSAICYEEQPGLRCEFKTVLEQIIDPVRVSHHYLGLARSTMNKHKILDREIKLKKLFYILRPLLALQWMEDNAFQHLPPMNFNQVLVETELDDVLHAEISVLLAAKAKTREIGSGSVPASIMEYVSERYSYFEASLPKAAHDRKTNLERQNIAQAFYSRIIENIDTLDL